MNQGYVEDIKNVMFGSSEEDLRMVLKNYEKDVPDPLTAQFTKKRSKAEAIVHHNQKKSTENLLYPSGKYYFYCCDIL